MKGEADIEYVSKKISYYLSEINVINPFREDGVIIGTRLEKPSKINGFALLSPIFYPMRRGERTAPYISIIPTILKFRWGSVHSGGAGFREV